MVNMVVKVEFDTGATLGYLPNYTSTLRDIRNAAKRLAPKNAKKYRIVIEGRLGRMRTFWKNLKTL